MYKIKDRPTRKPLKAIGRVTKWSLGCWWVNTSPGKHAYFPTVYWVKVSMDMLLWIYDVLWGVWVSSVIKTLAYGDSGLVPTHLRLKRAQLHFFKVSLLMSPRIKATFWLKACFHHLFGKGLPSSIPLGWSTRVLFCLLFRRTHFGRDEGYCRPFCFNFKILQSDPRRQLQPMKAIH